MRVLLFIIGVVVFVFFMNGCSVAYYSQSVVGHTSLMLSRQPISEVLLSADQGLQKRLNTAVKIRQFASDSLGLPDNKSYTSYVALKNEYPVWSVVAAEEFSLQAKQWCYLVIGCASYRGYYHQQAADNYAEKMKAQGYDVFVGGVAAYSTLGWFADPLTSAMLKRGDASLAELIFHELAHQQLYLKHNSRFNEAFASAVGEQGAIRWLTQTNRQSLLKRYLTLLAVRNDFVGLVNQTKSELSELYRSDQSIETKRMLKKTLFQQMKNDYQTMKLMRWNNVGWYDNWFDQPMNNARMVSVATYRDLVPEFVRLFERCDKDFTRFYRRVAEIAQQKIVTDHALDVTCSL